MKDTAALLLALGMTVAAGTSTAFGWSQNGHRVTAEIAERNLTPAAKAAVGKILGPETLAEISIWADDIRSDNSWDFAEPWHYISIDDDEAWEGLAREPEGVGDVLRILETLEKFLRDREAKTITLSGKMGRLGSELSKTVTKRDALAFYVHFVGDVHQPLHVGRREDQGGNKIKVQWFGEDTNLHKVWDEMLIASTDLSFTELATTLNKVPDEARREWTKSSYLDWAKESKEVRAKVYGFEQPRDRYFLNVFPVPALSYEYRHEALPIVRERLAQGGLRLAAKLNAIFGDPAKGE